jgi:hypothetical protein
MMIGKEYPALRKRLKCNMNVKLLIWSSNGEAWRFLNLEKAREIIKDKANR